ncbi:MAG: arginine--tRNA ligase [Ruminococcaceae bacterium]|nr:arginine--tRNA ligase [Oscillospiraceae bacterium]
MNQLKQAAAAAILAKINALTDSADLSAADIVGMFEYPPDPKMGDLAFPCFKLAKTLRQAPPKIAASLSDGLSIPGISRVDVAGGYLNMFTDKSGMAANTVNTILAKKETYGANDEGVGKTVVLDYSSPNVAKPFHIGHLGTTVIGHSLKKLHAFCGYDCIGINHLGDWGTQFGKMIVAYKRWGDRATVEAGECDALVDLYVKFHEEAEKDPSLNDEARAVFTAMEHGEPEYMELWKWIIDISLREYEKTYKQLGITFDSYAGESFYTDKMPAVVDELKQSNIMVIDDGASIVDLSEYNMPPCLILKRDGSTLYPARDIAAALYRKKTYNFDKCIYVTSSGQSLHFAQWFKVLELMGYEWAKDQLVHVPYGTVSIDGGKLSTRSGNVVLLRDLFNQAIEKVAAIMEEKNPDLEGKEQIAESVGVSAIIFYYLSSGRIRDINFIMEDALSFEGNTGPYAQYTYARSCSIVSKAQAAGMTDLHAPVDLTGVALTEEENALVKTLALFPDKVAQALHESEPSVITRYILDVCADFNRFYHDIQILSCEDEALRTFRVKLTLAVKYVLGTAFDLICIGKNEKI